MYNKKINTYNTYQIINTLIFSEVVSVSVFGGTGCVFEKGVEEGTACGCKGKTFCVFLGGGVCEGTFACGYVFVGVVGRVFVLFCSAGF